MSRRQVPVDPSPTCHTLLNCQSRLKTTHPPFYDVILTTTTIGPRHCYGCTKHTPHNVCVEAIPSHFITPHRSVLFLFSLEKSANVFHLDSSKGFFFGNNNVALLWKLPATRSHVILFSDIVSMSWCRRAC